MKNVKIILLFALVVLLAVAVLAGCNDSRPGDYDGEGQYVGEGDIVFRFEVTDADGEVTAWNVRTNEENLASALLEVELIAGEVVPVMGLLVTHVNDVRADWNLDDAYWALWVGDEMSMVGVDSVYIEEGVVYAFVFTPAA